MVLSWRGFIDGDVRPIDAVRNGEVLQVRIIYVATRGTHSDYSIAGVFSTKDNAQRFIDTFPDRDWNDIEEYEIDGAIDEINSGKTYYIVKMRKGGDFLEIARCVHSSFVWYGGSQVHWFHKWRGAECEPWANFYVWAKDETAAIKIANERRIMALAQ